MIQSQQQVELTRNTSYNLTLVYVDFRHETPEEGRRTYLPKRDYNNKDDINSLNILSVTAN